MPTPAQQLHNHLQTLKDGWPILSLIAAKKANIMARSTGNGTHSIAPIPVNIDAWQLKQDIDLLTRKLTRAAGLHPHRGMAVPALLKGIMLHETNLLTHDDADTITEQIALAAERMDRMLNPPPACKMIGPCPKCGYELWCTELEMSSGYKACDRCRGEWRIKDVQQASVLRLALGGAQGTAAAIARWMDPYGVAVKPNTITKWAKRGILEPVNVDENGNPVYNVWNVWQTFTRRDKDK